MRLYASCEARAVKLAYSQRGTRPRRPSFVSRPYSATAPQMQFISGVSLYRETACIPAESFTSPVSETGGSARRYITWPWPPKQDPRHPMAQRPASPPNTELVSTDEYANHPTPLVADSLPCPWRDRGGIPLNTNGRAQSGACLWKKPSNGVRHVAAGASHGCRRVVKASTRMCDDTPGAGHQLAASSARRQPQTCRIRLHCADFAQDRSQVCQKIVKSSVSGVRFPRACRVAGRLRRTRRRELRDERGPSQCPSAVPVSEETPSYSKSRS